MTTQKTQDSYVAQHFPGPWRARRAESSIAILGVDHGEEYTLARLTKGGRITDDGVEANAKLMAAAPDLLAALERIIEQTKDGEDGWNTLNTYPRLEEICETAHAAISKATSA